MGGAWCASTTRRGRLAALTLRCAALQPQPRESELRAPRRGNCGERSGDVEPVPLHLAIERRDMDAEHLRGAILVTLDFAQHALDVLALEVFQRHVAVVHLGARRQ